MKFSVVIPLYNKAPYIESTLGSVLAQTEQDFEIVVLDDGSTDDGAHIVARITDSRVRLASQPNAGVSAARNSAIARAQGEWVVFLDADDWQHPQYLENLLAAQKQHPEADVIAAQYIAIEDAGNDWPPAWQVPSTPVTRESIEIIEDLPGRWMKGPTFTTSSVSIRTSLLQRMQPCFVVGESQGEDLDMWFRVAEQSPIVWIKRPLIAYRSSVAGSLSGGHQTFDLPPFLHRIRARALSGALSATQAKSALKMVADQEISMARDALVSGQRIKAMRLLWRGHRSASKRRWWFTAAMTAFVPGELVKRWQHWRVRRTTPTMSAG